MTIRMTLAAAALTLSFTTLAHAQDAPLESQLVDAFGKVYGVHPGFRPNHAKGIVVEGSFRPSPEAATLSRAELFAGGSIPVTVRFSDAGGIPNVPDGSDIANPHGMALKFHLPDGQATDMVMISLKFFPVSTAEDFRDLLLSIAASPPDAAKPSKLEQFVTSHPTVAAAGATASTPESFATEEFFGINAFLLVNKAGQKQAVRYQIAPERVAHLSPADAANKPADFLVDELRERLGRGAVTFRLRAQLAILGDPTNDPAKPWPSDRKLVDLGVVTIDKPVANSLEAQKSLLFMPGALVDGIEQSDDPMVDVRDSAYAKSFGRRSQ